MQMTHHTPLVLSYAQSLLELAEEKNQDQAIGEELAQVREVLEQNPAFGQFLADPAISHAERQRVLEEAFTGKASPLLANFLGVLNDKARTNLLADIVVAYDDLMDEKHGKIEVDVTTAKKLTAEELESVREGISKALKKDAVVHQYVDESLIGGLLLRVQDQMIDASVKGQLAAIKRQIMTI